MDYLYPCVPELKIKDYQAYLAACRGLRRQLRAEYGWFARQWYRQDWVFFALLNDGMAGRAGTEVRSRGLGILRKRRSTLCHTRGLHLAAQINVLLVWHRLADSHQTPGVWLRRHLLGRAYRKAAAEAPAIERVICQQRDQAAALQLAGNAGYEAACEPTANLFCALFAYCAEDMGSAKAMRRAGYVLGQMLYLLDQVATYRLDQQYGYYNVYLQNGLSYAAACGKAQYLCSLAAKELARAYYSLDVKMNRGLLENILFQGLEETAANLGREKAKQWEEM